MFIKYKQIIYCQFNHFGINLKICLIVILSCNKKNYPFFQNLELWTSLRNNDASFFLRGDDHVVNGAVACSKRCKIFFWTGLCWILRWPRCSNQPKLLACKFLAQTFPWCLMFRRSKTAVWFYLILFSGRSMPLNYKSTVVLNPLFLVIFTTFTFLIVDSRQKAESLSWWVTDMLEGFNSQVI